MAHNTECVLSRVRITPANYNRFPSKFTRGVLLPGKVQLKVEQFNRTDVSSAGLRVRIADASSRCLALMVITFATRQATLMGCTLSVENRTGTRSALPLCDLAKNATMGGLGLNRRIGRNRG
jgi:hypothetical protein